MNSDIFHQGITILAAGFLGLVVWQIFNRKSGGVSMNAMRDAVGFSVVIAFLLEDAFREGGSTRDLTAAFWLVVGGWLFAKNSENKTLTENTAGTEILEDISPAPRLRDPVRNPPPPAPSSAPDSQSGHATLGVLSIVAGLFFAGFAMLSSTGCAQLGASAIHLTGAQWGMIGGAATGVAAANAPTLIKAGQAGIDKVAESTHTTQELAIARADLAAAEAAKAGLILLPKSAMPYAVEYRETATDKLITGGVYARRVYEVRETLAPVTVAPPPPAVAEVPSPKPQVSNPTLPPPGDATAKTNGAAQNNGGGISSGGGGSARPGADGTAPSISETRTYRANAHVVSASGALASLVTAATLEAEIQVSGAPGFSTAGGPVTLNGKVLSLSNAPPLDVSTLHFAGYTGVVTGSTLTVASRPGGDVQFEGGANLADGTLRATLFPTLGSSAAAFFQQLEIAGLAVFVSSVTTTNAVNGGGGSVRPSSADAVDMSHATMLGTHSRTPAGTLPITRKLISAQIANGKVSWTCENQWTQPSGIGGWAMIFWKSGDQLIGGIFDAFGNGQTAKGLENIYGGYLDGKQPAPGQAVYLVLGTPGETKSEPTERSNLILCEGTW